MIVNVKRQLNNIGCVDQVMCYVRGYAVGGGGGFGCVDHVMYYVGGYAGGGCLDNLQI